jgi:hypothetical protein
MLEILILEDDARQRLEIACGFESAGLLHFSIRSGLVRPGLVVQG